MGHADYLKFDGDWNAICDRCGFKFKASQLKEEWTGLQVCKECWEPRHPLDFERGIPDDPSVPWTRPDSDADTSATDVSGNTISTINSIQEVDDADVTLTVGSDHSICEYNTALTSNRTVTLDATGASQYDRFTVYRTAGGAFTLDVGGLQTIPASVNGVVIVEFNGTAWILIDYYTLGL